MKNNTEFKVSLSSEITSNNKPTHSLDMLDLALKHDNSLKFISFKNNKKLGDAQIVELKNIIESNPYILGLDIEVLYREDITKLIMEGEPLRFEESFYNSGAFAGSSERKKLNNITTEGAKAIYNLINTNKNIIFFNNNKTLNYASAEKLADILFKTPTNISYVASKEISERKETIKYILQEKYKLLNANQLVNISSAEADKKWVFTISKYGKFKDIPHGVIEIIGNNLSAKDIIITTKQRSEKFLQILFDNNVPETDILEFFKSNKNLITLNSLKEASNILSKCETKTILLSEIDKQIKDKSSKSWWRIY